MTSTATHSFLPVAFAILTVRVGVHPASMGQISPALIWLWVDANLVFAGGLWSQHLKQYLLNNGIAVLEANNYVDDGWQSWADQWNGGYDGAFFKSLSAAMHEVGGPLAAKLNPDRVAFRGWSGSAQMVRIVNHHHPLLYNITYIELDMSL